MVLSAPTRLPPASGRLPALLAAAGLLLTATTGALGPSVAVPALPGDAPLPLSLDAAPSPYLVTLLLAAAVLVSAAGTAAGLRALAAGWSPDPRRLLGAGAGSGLLLALLPPLGSGDALSYAAYARTALLGLDPFTVAPSALPGDPLADAVVAPWRETPSVYGPLATLVHSAVVTASPADPRGAVALLALLHLAAFLAVGLLLHLAAPDAAARRRAAVLWTANPLLLLVLVAGAHLDALLVLGVLAALLQPPARAALAGALVAAAVLVKASGGLALPALLLARRDRARVLTSTSLVLLPVLLLGGATLVHGLADASGRVSRATPWRQVASALEAVLPAPDARRLVGVLALALAVALGLALWRVLPAEPDRPAVRWGAVVVLPALLAAPYAMPWYDALGFGVLALVQPGRADRWLLAHTTLLALAHVPGLAVPLPAPLALGLPVLASGVVPVLLTALLVQVLRAPVRPVAVG